MSYDKMHDSITSHISYDDGFRCGEKSMLNQVLGRIDTYRDNIMNQNRMIQTQNCDDSKYKLLLIHNNVKLSLLMDIHDSLTDV